MNASYVPVSLQSTSWTLIFTTTILDEENHIQECKVTF